jgi:hypothetical protein
MGAASSESFKQADEPAQVTSRWRKEKVSMCFGVNEIVGKLEDCHHYIRNSSLTYLFQGRLSKKMKGWNCVIELGIRILTFIWTQISKKLIFFLHRRSHQKRFAQYIHEGEA